MNRTRAYQRDARHHAICRKKAICLSRDGNNWYSVDGKYAKGKIHCSCGICKVAGDSLATQRQKKLFDIAMREFEEDPGYEL